MLNLSDLIIGSSDSLRSAMQKMTKNRRGLLFVCDTDSHLVGVLSDGDLRRGLLEETLLMSPVAKIMNPDPITASSLPDAVDLLRKMSLVAVPVLDGHGRIQDAAVEDADGVLTVGATDDELRARDKVKTATVAIIPARGGSKRIPKKNLALLAGRSLLSWAIKAAKGSQSVSQVLVSTDDEEIAAEARKMNVEVPWLRPASLSGDDATTLSVVEHAVSWAVENTDPCPSIGVLLEPTSPLRRGDHIDRAIELLIDSGADCVMAVSEVRHLFNPEELLTIHHGELRPYLPYRTLDTRRLRGQQSSVYIPNGLVYAFRIDSLLANRSLFGKVCVPMVTPWEEFMDIDTIDDLKCAELRMEGRLH